MKYGLILSLLMVIAGVANAQENFFLLDSMKIGRAFRLESARGSVHKPTSIRISISDNYVPNGAKWKSQLAQPVIFDRVDSSMLPLAFSKVTYYYSKSDSMVRIAEYEWSGWDVTKKKKHRLIIRKRKKYMTTGSTRFSITW